MRLDGEDGRGPHHLGRFNGRVIMALAASCPGSRMLPASRVMEGLGLNISSGL